MPGSSDFGTLWIIDKESNAIRSDWLHVRNNQEGIARLVATKTK